MIYILYIVLYFLFLAIISICISYLVHKNNKKFPIYLKTKSSSQDIDDIMYDVKDILEKNNLKPSIENILEKTYKEDPLNDCFTA